MSETRIIIAGSRTFNDYDLLNTQILRVLKEENISLNNIRIISGHAKGADSLGEQFANNHNLNLTIIPADWEKYNKAAGNIRNEQMAKFATINNNKGILFAFWNGISSGTKNMIDIANEYNIQTYIIQYKENTIKESIEQMKHELFTIELKTIKNKDIRNFAEKILDDAPDYFFHVAASSTGKYHPQYALGDGGLMRHTKSVIRFYNHLMSIEQNNSKFTEREIDLGRVACLAHDIQKSGNTEYYEEKSNGGENKVFTVFNHPLLAAKYIMSYQDSYLTEEELKFIAIAIGSHMGQWNTNNHHPDIILPKPKTDMQQIIHLADYLASRKDIDVSFKDDNSAFDMPDINTYECPFPKYKGQLLVEVAKKDKSYLKWLYENQELREPLKTFIPQLLEIN